MGYSSFGKNGNRFFRYARDKKILKELGWYNENGLSVDGKLGKLFPDCVIICPVVQVEENDDEDSPNSVVEKDCACQNDFMENTSIIHQCDEIKAFEGFYKIAIPLPEYVWFGWNYTTKEIIIHEKVDDDFSIRK